MRSLASIALAVLLLGSGIVVSLAGERHATAELEESLCLGCPHGHATLTESAQGGSNLTARIRDLVPGAEYELHWYTAAHCGGTATTIESFTGNPAGQATVNDHLDVTLDQVKSIGIVFESQVQNCGTFAQ